VQPEQVQPCFLEPRLTLFTAGEAKRLDRLDAEGLDDGSEVVHVAAREQRLSQRKSDV